MNATTTTTDLPGRGLATRERQPIPHFLDLVAAEWIKHRSLRSTWIAYGTTALAVVGFNAGIAYDTYSHWTLQVSKDRTSFASDGIALQQAFSANAALLMTLALGVIGALTIIGEYSTGTIRTTFAAVPARRSVMAAKAVVVTVVTTVFGAFVAGVSSAVTQAILDGRDAGVSISAPGAFRVVLASALLAPVCALMRPRVRRRHPVHRLRRYHLGGGHPCAAPRPHRRPPLVGGRPARLALPCVAPARGGRRFPDALPLDHRWSLDRVRGVGMRRMRDRRHQRPPAGPVSGRRSHGVDRPGCRPEREAELLPARHSSSASRPTNYRATYTVLVDDPPCRGLANSTTWLRTLEKTSSSAASNSRSGGSFDQRANTPSGTSS